MIILGIDPGTRCTGFGIIQYKNNSFRYISSGVIRPSAKEEIPLRLKKIYSEITSLISLYHPDQFSIETAFYGQNAQAALKLGQARGVSLLAAVNNGIPVTEYSPREIKKAVVGNGSSTKEQVLFMIQTILNLKSQNLILDESDALAIAVCHALKINTSTPKSSSWKDFIEQNPDKIIG
ncbi:MAG: crossover junction endodeoxyribonuclease RuvC [Rhodothermaceae bacterium]